MTTDLPHERWLPVPGYGGHYSVSNLGRVRSESRTIMDKNGNHRRVAETILKPIKIWCGHLYVNLYENRKPKKHYVHRLVLEAFVGDAPPGMHACHWNDDPEDNRLENLRWGTPTENRLDSVRNGGHYSARKTHCKRGHEFTPENTRLKAGTKARICRTCESSRYMAKTRGMTLDEYLAANPPTTRKKTP